MHKLSITSGPLNGLAIPRLRGCPASGQGVHSWLFYAAATLIPFVPMERDEELAAYLEARITRLPSPPSEAADAVRSARRGDALPKKKQARVCFDEYRAQAMVSKLPIENYEQFLAMRSPMDPQTVSLEAFFSGLYNAGETVLLFHDQLGKGWRYRVGESTNLGNFQAGEAGAWFLANPVTGQSLLNPRTQKLSRRSKENVTAFRYVLIESDRLPFPQWTSILAQVPLPIVSVTHSAGKSLHALVRAEAKSEAEYEEVCQKLRSTLVPLGIDEAALTSVRLTRLPGFLRKGREQKLLYFNPAADGTAIQNLAERRAA